MAKSNVGIELPNELFQKFENLTKVLAELYLTDTKYNLIFEQQYLGTLERAFDVIIRERGIGKSEFVYEILADRNSSEPSV